MSKIDKDFLKKLKDDKLNNDEKIEKSLPFRNPPQSLLNNTDNQNNSESQSDKTEEKKD